MNGHPFQSFIGLIEFDQQNLVIEKNIRHIHAEIDRLLNEQNASASELEAMHHAVLSLRKQVDLAELEVKSFDTEIKQIKKRLEFISSPREYQSINQELAIINEQQLAKDELLLATWSAYESAQKKYVTDQARHQAVQEKIRGEIAQLEADLANEQAQLNACVQERLEKERGVPQEWLEKYAAMRERVADPVVPVDRGQCSACSQTVIDQDLIELNRKKLLQCKGCFRFLYTDAIKAA